MIALRRRSFIALLSAGCSLPVHRDPADPAASSSSALSTDPTTAAASTGATGSSSTTTTAATEGWTWPTPPSPYPTYPPARCDTPADCPSDYACLETVYQDPSSRRCIRRFEYYQHSCDPFEQDCPAGYKCAFFYAEIYEAACVPLLGDDAHGEACAQALPVYYEDWGDGWYNWVRPDNCSATSQCVLDDRCHEFCVYNAMPYSLTCAHPSHYCGTGRVSYWCIEACDPLAPACADGGPCIPQYSQEPPTCWPPGPSRSSVYEPCDSGDCAPGLACVGVESVLECEGLGTYCCTPYCDTREPNPCEGKAQACVPWYGDWENWDSWDQTPEWAFLGVCSLPG